ncbi:MAG: hypothetical protein CMJ18_17175 [Phycisphaeraceae bacterium]|nr:hypothetical protein [Phycisphaeraceae bacterium]
MKDPRLAVFLLTGSCLVLGAVPGAAAPILPTAGHVSDEIRSLSGLEAFRVVIDTEASTLSETPIVAETLKSNIEKYLEGAGFRLEEDPATPLFKVTLITRGDDRHEEVVALSYQITVRQLVSIPRIDRKVLVPTYTLVHGALLEKDDLRKHVDIELVKLARFVIGRIRMAGMVEPVKE